MEFGHDQKDCPYEVPCFWKAYSMGTVSCASGWFWLLEQQTPSPPQAKTERKVRRRRQRGDTDLEWEEPERPAPEWEKPDRPQPKRGESVRPQPKRGKAKCPQPRYPPAEGEHLLIPPPPPWEDCVSLPPPPAEGEFLLVPPPPPWEDCVSLPPPSAEEECLLVLPPPPWEDYLPLPAPPAEEECLLVPPPPPEKEEQELPLSSRQDGPGEGASSLQPPLHRLLSRARGKTAGSQRLRRGPTPAPLLVLAPLLQSPPEGLLPPSPPDGPLSPSPPAWASSVPREPNALASRCLEVFQACAVLPSVACCPRALVPQCLGILSASRAKCLGISMPRGFSSLCSVAFGGMLPQSLGTSVLGHPQCLESQMPWHLDASRFFKPVQCCLRWHAAPEPWYLSALSPLVP
ncbi:UNVERIFIED_CONTAM: hypothetical protein FKN15_064780 [Acipenser sinensis]